MISSAESPVGELPLDANSADVVIEQLVLENEGWERDTSVTEPVEPK